METIDADKGSPAAALFVSNKGGPKASLITFKSACRGNSWLGQDACLKLKCARASALLREMLCTLRAVFATRLLCRCGQY